MPLDGLSHSALSVAWLLIKAYLVVILIFWIRGTYPRLRIDQLMTFSWKVLVPLSFANIVVTGIVLYYGWHWSLLTVISLILLAGLFLSVRLYSGTAADRMTISLHPARSGAVSERKMD